MDVPIATSGGVTNEPPQRSGLALKVAGFGLGLGVTQKVLSETRIVASVLTNPKSLGLTRPLILERPAQVGAGLLMFKSWNGSWNGRGWTGIVPPNGGKWNLWGHAFKLSQLLKVAAIPTTFFLAATNVPDGWSNGGPEGLIGSKSGRSGVISSLAAVAQIGFLIRATRGMGGHGARQAILGTLGNPSLSSWGPVAISTVAWGLFALNEAGGLDSLDTNNSRTVGQTLGDAGDNALTWVRHPTQYFRQSK